MFEIFQKLKEVFLRRKSHQPDYALISTVAVIAVFGLIMMSSASTAFSYIKFDQDPYFFFKKQIVALAVGVIGFLVLAKIDYRVWRKQAIALLFVSIVLLIMVLIPGLAASDKARSWINFRFFTLQPSEIVKIFFLIYLSAWLESKRKTKESTGQFYVLLGIISFLMLLQPDLGTLSIIVASSLAVYFVSGENVKNILGLIAVGLLSILIMIQIKPYQMNRFRCFLDSSYSPGEVCYQVNQSLIAIGSGGIFGRGLGESRQKFFYLPEVYGDSIFAIIGEETGLVFSSLLVLLFAFIFFRGYLISRDAPDEFGKYLAIGIASWFSIQAVINIGGMVNLMPMTGVPLPFISYGGSSLVANLAALGILINISKQTK